MDVLEGEIKTPLPSGRYRVAATKGIEWASTPRRSRSRAGARSRDRARAPSRDRDARRRELRRCTCTRPSFDSPVTTEDRVLSLVAAGIDFAVPTEHNMVGDYAPYIDVLKVNKQLATVTGVEVTTYNPRFGTSVYSHMPPARASRRSRARTSTP